MQKIIRTHVRMDCTRCLTPPLCDATVLERAPRTVRKWHKYTDAILVR